MNLLFLSKNHFEMAKMDKNINKRINIACKSIFLRKIFFILFFYSYLFIFLVYFHESFIINFEKDMTINKVT